MRSVVLEKIDDSLEVCNKIKHDCYTSTLSELQESIVTDVDVLKTIIKEVRRLIDKKEKNDEKNKLQCTFS